MQRLGCIVGSGVVLGGITAKKTHSQQVYEELQGTDSSQILSKFLFPSYPFLSPYS